MFWHLFQGLQKSCLKCLSWSMRAVSSVFNNKQLTPKILDYRVETTYCKKNWLKKKPTPINLRIAAMPM